MEPAASTFFLSRVLVFERVLPAASILMRSLEFKVISHREHINVPVKKINIVSIRGVAKTGREICLYQTYSA